MSIAAMKYVMCDECGNPGPLADDAREARATAHREGFARAAGRDLCRECVRRFPAETVQESNRQALSAAKEVLTPVVVELQQSAVDLLDRMVSLGRGGAQGGVVADCLDGRQWTEMPERSPTPATRIEQQMGIAKRIGVEL